MGRHRKVISTEELTKLTPEELKKFIKKQHRRDLCRVNQQRYRDRQKQREADLEAAITILKSKLTRVAAFNALMKEGGIVDPYHSVQVRGLVASIYGDMFNFGMSRRDASYYKKQESFLDCNFDEKLIVLSEKFPPGVDALIEQWKKYTTLHEQFRMQKVAVEKIDPMGNLFRLTTELSFIVSHRTIAKLYPHMLLDQEFLRLALGKKLAFKCNQILQFNEHNHIATLHAEYEMVQAWLELLKNPALVAKVIGEKLIDSSCYIVADVDPDDPDLNDTEPAEVVATARPVTRVAESKTTIPEQQSVPTEKRSGEEVPTGNANQMCISNLLT